MIRLLIADDHPIFRNGLRSIIDEEEDMEVTDEVGDGREVFKYVSENTYDALILDIDMGDTNGLDVLQQVRHAYLDFPILMLSFFPEEQYAIRALKLGASGYLTKEIAAEGLVTALRRIIAGKRYITPDLAERLADQLDGDFISSPHEQLSDREYQVFIKIAEGKSLGDISRELNLSPKTVSTYKTRIYEKMYMRSDNLIVRYAIDHGLVK
ncbi:MAG: response regulator transcription factor [Myxococcota bacterium]|nr:response regulator transcription factor [Myxococcota bacterium]